MWSVTVEVCVVTGAFRGESAPLLPTFKMLLLVGRDNKRFGECCEKQRQGKEEDNARIVSFHRDGARGGIMVERRSEVQQS